MYFDRQIVHCNSKRHQVATGLIAQLHFNASIMNACDLVQTSVRIIGDQAEDEKHSMQSCDWGVQGPHHQSESDPMQPDWDQATSCRCNINYNSCNAMRPEFCRRFEHRVVTRECSANRPNIPMAGCGPCSPIKEDCTWCDPY
jgi:hypothetical protein